MDESALNSVSPIDGRYSSKTRVLSEYFSEKALICRRIEVEVEYLLALSKVGVIRKLSPGEKQILKGLVDADNEQVGKVKEIERRIQHDVKAVEYYVRGKLEKTSGEDLGVWVHFCLTSEDVNNLAYRLMLKRAHEQVMLPRLKVVLGLLADLGERYADLTMLARTHGQPAIPTTLGKEICVFAGRLLNQIKRFEGIGLTGKLNGAVGGYQSFDLAFEKIDWINFSQAFVEGLGLKPNQNTTQINPADDVVDFLSVYLHINSILIGLNQDVWRYISDEWLVQKKADNVGSSTMPQKINPIEFENSEGNLIMANGLIETLVRKLPVSRLQRDLSDSTVMRNLGVVFGHSLLAYGSLQKGLESVSANHNRIEMSLNENWNILAEALQIYLRTTGDVKAYEQVAVKMKNKVIGKEDWLKITKGLDEKIYKLTPGTYTGYSDRLTKQVVREVRKYLGNHKLTGQKTKR